jgi:hypothetical protein
MSLSKSSAEPETPRKKLENNLRNLLDDERFFDIELKCSDSVTLHACKNILCVRSEVFNDHIFGNSSDQSKLEFSKINSIAIKFVLEYLYTSNNEREILRVNNVVEIYYSAIYFNLNDLQKDIINFTNLTLREGDEDLGKTLLSEYIEKFSLKADNEMGKLLVDWVAKMQLFPEEADKDSLSLKGLQYLLEKTKNTRKSFATYELVLLEYLIVKTKQIVLEENVESSMDPYFMKYDSSTLEQIKEHLDQLLPHIDLNIIDSDEIVRRIEPLKIFPQEMITDAYRYKVEIKHESQQPMRGYLVFKWENFDEKSWQSENKLRITDNGFTVEVDSNLKKYKSIMGDLTIKGKGTHKWDILVEKLNNETGYIGICGFEDQFDKPGDKGFHGWALGSDGYVYNKKDWTWNNAVFKENDVVNIIVNMNTKHCYFGVNGDIRYEVFGNAFPDEVYPFVSLKKGGKLRVLLQ